MKIKFLARTALAVIVCMGFPRTPSFAQARSEKIPFAAVEPKIITDKVQWDTDDPAIWINPVEAEKSLVIGTDKNTDGALYAFNLEGGIVKRFGGLLRPNNVDVAYGFPWNGALIDIAVVTEREAQRIRVFKLPDLEPIDIGDLIVFEGDTRRAPMGIALYKRQKDNAFFVFVGGKSGPKIGYVAQYRIVSNSAGTLKVERVREFGRFSGKEIESIAVDAELGYVYYSDETVGLRKYHADPDVPGANEELAMFGDNGFKSNREGISIYKTDAKTGYIIVSDQQADQFRIFTREGMPGNPHMHQLVKVVKLRTRVSDGNEVTSIPLLPRFPKGLFVAMSEDKTFHYYSWEDIAGAHLVPR